MRPVPAELMPHACRRRQRLVTEGCEQCGRSSPAERVSSARTCASASSAEGHEVICVDNLITGSPANIEHLRGQPALHLHPPRHLASARDRRPDRQRPALRLAGQPGRLPATTRSRRSRSARSARTTPWAWPRRRTPASCWPAPARSTATRRASAARGLLGQRQPHRRCAAATTRRSASPRRSTMAYHRYSRRRYADHSHLQHLRPAHAARRRPGAAEFHGPGAARRAADGLRRRLADAQLLLRRRSGRGHRPAARSPTSTSRSTSAIPTR